MSTGRKQTPKASPQGIKIHKLVYYEETPDKLAAIEREKQIKGWSREKKNKLIEAQNPGWEDLSKGWAD